ncbi:hypothetical protein SODG_004546 [Sodalis praecaptivus]
MDSGSVKGELGLTLDSLNNITILSLIEHFAIPWGIKDTKSRNVYMNDTCKDFLDIPKKFSYEGKTDNELPCLWAPLNLSLPHRIGNQSSAQTELR